MASRTSAAHWASDRQISELVLERTRARADAEPTDAEVASGAAVLRTTPIGADASEAALRQAAAAVLRAARQRPSL